MFTHFCPLQGKLDAITKLKQAEADLANAQESIEEEQDSKAELQKQLVNAKSEAASWKNKFDSEATPRIEELEDAKYVTYAMFIE